MGTWLGIAFTICFLTGLWSHLQQTTPGWLTLPVDPAWLYRVTQGVHVIAGTAAVPLLLVKLWSVYPRLFLRPPRGTGALALHALERLSILALVAAAIFQLASGLTNIVQWYPWAFSFRATHYAVAWIAIGALLLHLAVKWPAIRAAYAREGGTTVPLGSSESAEDARTRRSVLVAAGVAAGLAVVLTAGQTVPWLRRVSVLAVRSGDGPQGLPVNRTAAQAGVARPTGWQLEVVHGDTRRTFTLDDLTALPQTTRVLPIACVEGWSRSAEWTGVPVRTLLAMVGAPASSEVHVSSLQTRRAFGTSDLPPAFAADPRTLLALRLNGEELDLDHGWPCRLIAPNRPGVRQTKWVTRLEVRT
ncbi:molybdopterin-dependent oxidoreductase [Mumia qirimensis]|uniref:molybdopterin-dependent oxidoreductase n=1 Tax=Mumia qirimensis TaxID=3234852 RepID=UPI00351CF630